mgnify:CR=1 FL=1
MGQVLALLRLAGHRGWCQGARSQDASLLPRLREITRTVERSTCDGLGECLAAYGAGLRALVTTSADGVPGLDQARLRQADWVLTTYEDCDRVLRAPKAFSNNPLNASVQVADAIRERRRELPLGKT